MTEIESEKDWCIKCSYEDLRDLKEWQPEPELIEQNYELISNDNFTELKFTWVSPGYRETTPELSPEEEPEEFEKEEEIHTSSDFDFKDEMGQLRLRVRKEGESELKGSGKKKTTSLDDVLSNMRRHWKMQQDLDKEADEFANESLNDIQSPGISSNEPDKGEKL